jgi:hypothetical protein
LQLSDKTDDTYLRAWVLFIVAWDYLNRGLAQEARRCADQLNCRAIMPIRELPEWA